jgi:hypothetical protein
MADMDRGVANVRERGAILPLMAILLVVLMGAAAMAVDLGWLFWQSIEVQHGADAAALAGVVYEPDFRTDAHAEAIAAAAQNGYVDGAPGTTVAVVDFVDDPSSVEYDSMLRVTVTHKVDTFFMKVFGLNDVDISRTAVAEYVLPLPMGSPESFFGDDPAREIYSGGFTGKVHGNWIPKARGDRFGALCANSGAGIDCLKDQQTGGAPNGFNPEARQSSGWGTAAAQGGYVYGIEVAEGASGLKVEIFDGALYSIKENSISGPDKRSFFGDHDYRGATYKKVEATTWFMLYGPDPTPTDSTDGNELLCSISYDERIGSISPNASSPPNSSAYLDDFGAMGWDITWLEFDSVRDDGYQNILDAMWDDMGNVFVADYASADCSQASFDRGPGIYLLRVLPQHDDSGEVDWHKTWRGMNSYSLRVSTTSGDQPTVYAVGDMLIRTARNTVVQENYLARVDQRYAGRDLIIELWDVGDQSGGGVVTDSFSILMGDGSIPNCDWSSTKPDSGSGACTILAGKKRYDNHMMNITVEIPDDYTCTGNGCWWKVRYNYDSFPVHDTTTWSAYIDGNPIRLVE